MNIQEALADGYDLTAALHMTLAENQEAIEGMRRQAHLKAQADRDYKAELARVMLHMRAGGKVAASMIKDAAHSNEKVADLLFNAELQDGLWEACREEVMLRKREADVLREEIARMHAEAGRAW